MKKLYSCFLFILCLLLFLLALSSCSKPTDSISDSSILLMEAYVSLTDGKFEEAIDEFSAYKEKFKSPNLTLEIGMGKAYFGIGDYGNAEIAFERAYKIDATRSDVIHYLGEAQMQTENYKASVETFKKLLEKEPDNQTALSKLERSLIKNKDYYELYKFYEDRIKSINDKTKLDYYSYRLIEAAQMTNDDSLLLSAIEKYKDTEQFYAMDVAYKAYKLIISGDEEAAKTLLFDIEIINDLMDSTGQNSFCFVNVDNPTNNYQGRGLMMMGSGNSTACKIYVGEFFENKPQGEGIGYSGYISEWESEGKKYLQKSNTYIDAEWKEGHTEGFVTRTDEYTTYQEGNLQYSNKEIVTANYENGLAQGEVWTESHYQNYESGSNYSGVSFIKHFAVDGIPVPFEVIEYGRRIMAYEAYYGDSKNNSPYADTEDCSRWCQFIL